MARSDDAGARVLAGVLLALAGLSAVGCATTQQAASRLQLNSARIRAAEVPTRVTRQGRLVRVIDLRVVSRAGQTAFVVRARNAGSRPVADLPVSVGVRDGRRRLYLNASSPLEFSYFSSHLPVVPPGATITWVWTTRRSLPARERPFALVGPAPAPRAPVSGRLPVVTARVLGAPAARRGGRREPPGSVRVRVENRSGIPQYQLQVIAVGRRGERVVAAADLTIPELDAQSDTTATLDLVGDLRHARLQALAVPTVLQ